MSLHGRRSECESLDRLIADAFAGRSRVVVLRGDAGVGKSALLDHVSDRISGWRLARAVGVESEMELAYAGLHQLCAPMLGSLDRLPGPQRNALATVFGRSAGAAPDRFLVGLATLTLFADAAEQQPLVCIVDDAQWLDRASAQILGFVARRLLAERVALIFAARTGIGDDLLTGLPELVIAGLAEADARAVLLDHVHGPVDAAVCDQIVAECHGNPLALRELPRVWQALALAGGLGLPDSRPVAGRIEQSYVQRLQELPSETQLLVLTAAAEPLGEPVLLHRAAAALGADVTAIGPAVEAGLLRIGARAEFAHPLVRSAAYGAAAAGDRHRVHRALADATNAETDPDRRAWHRARATEGRDEEVAAELERSASRARARGGLSAAAAFLQRAVDLTPDPSSRAVRALAAAQATHHAGAPDAARHLLTIAHAGPLDALEHAKADLLQAQIAFDTTRGRDAPPLLLQTAKRLESLDATLARETYLDAFSAALFAGRLAEGVGAREVAEAVLAAAWDDGDGGAPRAADLLLHGLALLTTQGYAAGAGTLKRGLAAFRDEAMPEEQALRWLWLACHTARALGDDAGWDEFTARQERIARESGALSLLPLALAERSAMLLYAGRRTIATSLVAEANDVIEATGGHGSQHAALFLAAYAGREAELLGLIESARQDVAQRGEGLWLIAVEWTTALLYNGLARYEEALVAAERLAERPYELGLATWVAPELIEAAARTGNHDRALGPMRQFAAIAEASGTDWALGIEARSRALVSEGGEAEQLHLTSIERLSRTRIHVALARAHLLYGEWLRRERRRSDAREQLRIAHRMFNENGMDGFAERARRELVATGEKVRRRVVESRDELTPQEAQIARLARKGLSNPEIGAQLFLSARTVEWHLSKVFSKLGIGSRRELRAALSEDELLITSV